MERRSSRWRLAAAGFAAAAVVLVAMLVVDPRGGGSDGPPTQAATVVNSVAPTTDVAVSPRGWGTEIVLDITGLPTRDSYQLWTVDADGAWISAATWSPTPAGIVHLTGASRTPTDEIERIVITSTQRDDLLVDATP